MEPSSHSSSNLLHLFIEQFGPVLLLLALVLFGYVWHYSSYRSYSLDVFAGTSRIFHPKCCRWNWYVHYNWVVIVLVFQFVYTTLFGALVSYIYIRTGSLLAAIFAHSLCNFLTFPSFEFLDDHSPTAPKRKGTNYLLWLTIPHILVIGSMYITGIILYIASFTTLLNPTFFQSQFYSIRG